jgi:hypothetical protein
MTETWKKTNYKFVDEPTFIYYFDKEEIMICDQSKWKKGEMKSDDKVFLRFVNALEISIERPNIKESKLLTRVDGSDSDNDNEFEYNADKSLIDEDYYNLPKAKGYAKEHYLRG